MNYTDILDAITQYHTSSQKSAWKHWMLQNQKHLLDGDIRLAHYLQLPLPKQEWQHLKHHIGLISLTFDYYTQDSQNRDSFLTCALEQCHEIVSFLTDDQVEQLLKFAVQDDHRCEQLLRDLKKIGHPFVFHSLILQYFASKHSFFPGYFKYYLTHIDHVSPEGHAVILNLLPDYAKSLTHDFQRWYMYLSHIHASISHSIPTIDEDKIIPLLASILFAHKNTRIDVGQKTMIDAIFQYRVDWSERAMALVSHLEVEFAMEGYNDDLSSRKTFLSHRLPEPINPAEEMQLWFTP